MDAKMRQGAIVERAQSIQAKADAEKRDITPQEAAEIEQLLAEFDRLDQQDDLQADAAYYAKLRSRLNKAASGKLDRR
jgi:hypothetical protein